jgi:hypothetical protein
MATQTLFGGATALSAQALTVNYAASLNDDLGRGAGIIRVAGPCDIIGRADIAVTAATRVEFQVQVSSLGANDWFTLPFATESGGFVEFGAKAIAVDGAIAANVPVLFHVPGGWPDHEAGGDVRILARRVDGGAGTTLFMDGEVRLLEGGPSLAQYFGGGAMAGAGAGVTGASFVSAAAAVTTGAYVYGNEFEAGSADQLLLHVAKTTANNPTNVDFDVQCSDDAGVTWETIPQTDQVAAGVTTQQGMTLRTQEIGAAVGNFLYAVDIYPGLRYRVGVLFTGGAAPTLAIDCQLLKR